MFRLMNNIKIYNLLSIFLLVSIFIFTNVQNKELLLSLGTKFLLSIFFMYLILKTFKVKYYLLTFINILFILTILFLSSNSLKSNMMTNIEIYYVDKYPANKELINDNKFSNEASHQKYYAKHANEVKPSLIDYIKYSQKLEYNKIYYYELCLFFKDNICIFKHERELSKEDYIHEEYDYKFNKLKYYYRPIEWSTDYKEGILKRDSKFEDLNRLDNLSCLYIFYGAQNGWLNYQKELLKRIKLDKQCYEDLNSHFIFSNKELENKNKLNMINFLEYIIKNNYD